MEGRSKGISVLIFLLGIFVLLAVVLGGWLYNMYTTNVGYTKKTTTSALHCNDMSFTVQEIKYSPDTKTLSFMLNNGYGQSIDAIVIESNNQTQTVNLTGLVSGTSEIIEVQTELASEVLIYPRGCREDNAKRYTIQ
jgi:hypothetical protein